MLEKQRRYRELVDQPRIGSRSIDNIKLAQQYQNKAQQYYNKP